MTSVVVVDADLTSFAPPRALTVFEEDWLRGFAALQTLILDSNRIERIDLPQLPALETLSLNNNEIDDLQALDGHDLRRTPALRHLSLVRNPSCPFLVNEDDYRRFRKYVLFRMPTLAFLDCTPVTPDEVAEAKKNGMFCLPRRYKPASTGSAAAASSGDSGAQAGDDASSGSDDDGDRGALPASPGAPGEDNGLDKHPDDARIDKPAARFGVSRYVYFGRQSEGNRFITKDML